MYPAQSKSGECLLQDYALHDAPEDVMADANRHAPFVCVMCKTVFEVDVQNRKTVQLEKTAEEVRQEMWNRLESGDPSQGRSEVEANVIAMMASEKEYREEGQKTGAFGSPNDFPDIHHERASAFARELKTVCNKYRIQLSSSEEIFLTECPMDEKVTVHLELEKLNPNSGLQEKPSWGINAWVGDFDTGLTEDME
jgi:hypothetical protein